ncbi:hypothetical protein EDD18DRAFT_1109725 [Armillaria luteobubalina]|uniref:Uncharacterized protein n=1 Tax=Armillaria luteobubalina TaxID=153913 RepID=A0AA39PTB7_9AGAR|nr:hypothetical protein EDD18DRAFT_1109725 [Armillaria luteobubalina]
MVALHVACPTHIIQHWNGAYFDKVPLRTLDNTNTKTPSDNYGMFARIVCEWSFIWQLKRAGIGNDPGGWKNAKLASCAVECLACPWPGINIPKVINPNEYMLSFSIKIPDAWLYTLYLGMDGNFHLERFDVSSEDKDPDFDKRIIQPSSMCSNHEATKGDNRTQNQTRDLTASRVGGVVCTRHELKLPLSMVDLRVGEIQVEMDFGYLSAVKCFDGIPQVVMSYDIACQWSINLDKRIEIYGDHILYLVPKFHLPGHIEECQEKYCMSFHTKVGNNDGEVPERGWAVSNGVAASTHEMGPGHRREKLDQHFGDYNWQKNIAQVEAWEADRTKLNPFTQTVANKTEAAMRLQLAQEDAQDELASLNGDEFHTTSLKDVISQESWFIVQEVHMPMVRGLRIRDDKGNGPSLPTYSLPLYLPSSILSAHTCKKVLTQAEFQLCVAQGYNLLHTIHSQLLSLSKAYKDGNTNILMQKERLKCHKITQDLNTCITQAKQCYCDVRKRLLVLSEVLGEQSWQVQLRILEDSDVCISNGARHVHEPTDGEKNVSFSVLDLWLSRASSTSMGGSLIQAGEGATAYVKHQASIRKSIRKSFEKKWLYADQYIALGETDKSLSADDDDVFVPESAMWEEWGLEPEVYLTRHDPKSIFRPVSGCRLVWGVDDAIRLVEVARLPLVRHQGRSQGRPRTLSWMAEQATIMVKVDPLALD